MKLFRYYGNAVLYPSLFVVLFGIINSITINYERGGFADRSALVISVITSLIFSVLMCVFSLTIFFNKIRRLNKYLIWNILSWLLLPFTYLTIVFIHDLKIRITYDFGFGRDFFHLLIMTIPFVIGLCWTLISYRQELTQKNIA